MTPEEREFSLLCNKAFVFKSAIKEFKWVVVFTRMPPRIRGEIPGFFIKKKLKWKKQHDPPYTWGAVDFTIFERQRIPVKELPKKIINLLLREFKHIKYR